MKAKSLIVLMAVVLLLLVYSMVCYHILNDRIEISTRNTISNYFSTNIPEVTTYQFLQAVSEKENTFQVFVKAENDYYTFNFSINDQRYQIQSVELGIPSYIS